MGERVMDPNYGGNLENLLFSATEVDNIAAASTLSKAISSQEPEITVTLVTINEVPGNGNSLAVKVDYVVNSTQDANTVTVLTGGSISQVNP